MELNGKIPVPERDHAWPCLMYMKDSAMPTMGGLCFTLTCQGNINLILEIISSVIPGGGGERGGRQAGRQTV